MRQTAAPVLVPIVVCFDQVWLVLVVSHIEVVVMRVVLLCLTIPEHLDGTFLMVPRHLEHADHHS